MVRAILDIIVHWSVMRWHFKYDLANHWTLLNAS